LAERSEAFLRRGESAQPGTAPGHGLTNHHRG